MPDRRTTNKRRGASPDRRFRSALPPSGLAVARGGGGIKSLASFGSATAWGVTRRFFFWRRRFDYSNRNQRIQTAPPSRPQRKDFRALILKRSCAPPLLVAAPERNYFSRWGGGPQISGPFRAGTGGLGAHLLPQITARTFFKRSH
jgi:hypothetical protein